ncbi:MAG TPA: amylo-alpha-1,6-glucosidase [Rhizomicrobium sp.]|nr:amylo-alpha-1,6-glucosidase [Rhizomicrobium sp.]
MTPASDEAVPEHTPVAVPEFYIPATLSTLEHWPRMLKHGDTFALFDRHGDIINTTKGPGGIFHEDTRYLSRFYILIDGYRPLLLSSQLQDDNAVLTVDLANPDIYRGDELIMTRETLHIVRAKYLWDGACHERIAIHNFDTTERRAKFSLHFAADFADLFEVRGIERAHHGTMRTEFSGPDCIVFHYMGLDGVERNTRLRFSPQPSSLSEAGAVYDLTLAPGQRWPCFVTIQYGTELPAKPLHFLSGLRLARQTLRKRAANSATITTSNEVLNQVFCRSIADLTMLMTDTPQGPYPYAGIPWFSTPFGRDGIITAMQMLWLDPTIAMGVLKFLAATQAKTVDTASDAEPGKILHEMRRGEMARLGEVPFAHYYGSVDATPLFVMLAGRYFERTGDLATIASIKPNIEAALAWMDTFGDPDGDGFVEYRCKAENGLGNQGWKDSQDAIVHEDGTLAESPIALVEVQAYVFAAKRAAARLFRALGDARRANALENEARRLRARFEEFFWCPDLGTYALALDRDKKQCRVVTSNPGHALFSGIADPGRAALVAKTMMRRENFSGWGVRTMSSNAARYNPMSYHNGSIWPHDNALIALGLARYGLKDAALAIFSGFFDALHYMDDMRLPELFCGFPRRRSCAPTLYPVACMPQAWASAAPFSFLEAALGLSCDFARREIRFDHPRLPHFIDEVCIRRLKLGDAHIAVRLARHNGNVALNVLEREGDVRVVVVN